MATKKIPAYEQLEKSSVFCMAPWIHLHVWPTGTVMPCCVTNTPAKDQLGNTHKNTLKEIWNSINLKQLRLDMLNGNASKYCTNCYELEKNADAHSLRQSLNLRYGENHFSKVLQTQEDGSHLDPNFVYMDIRFSNICNLKCRTCNPTWSSSWYDDYEKAHGSVPKSVAEKKFIQITDKDKLLNEILDLIDVTEGVYWAGGEPFVTKEHWHVMDYWIANNKAKDISIDYTTNFSQLKYKNRNLFDLWKPFKEVKIHASLDGAWERGEYIRKGLDWNQVVENRNLMLEHCPHIQFEITPTVSTLNVLHLPDFHQEWLEQGLLAQPNDFRFHPLFSPVEFCIRNLPDYYKNRVVERWTRHKEWLTQNYDLDQIENILGGIDGLIKFIYSEKQSNLDLLSTLSLYDKVRNESWQTVFPELEYVLSNQS